MLHEEIDVVSVIPNVAIYVVVGGTVVLSRWAGGHGNHWSLDRNSLAFEYHDEHHQLLEWAC